MKVDRCPTFTGKGLLVTGRIRGHESRSLPRSATRPPQELGGEIGKALSPVEYEPAFTAQNAALAA